MFLTLQSKSKCEDGKDDFNFEYIGSKFSVDHISQVQEGTNIKDIIRASSAGGDYIREIARRF